MASVPSSLLLAISSPYARRGALWNAYDQHFGRDGDPVLVWQASTGSMNPTIASDVIERALVEDESAARAEYFAEFRRDIESFVSREAVEHCVIAGRRELPPASSIRYVAFCDPSGGSADSMTLAIAHLDGQSGKVILDAVRERKPPFSPEDVVREFTETLKSYRVSSVTGDRYGGEWPAERFREHRIVYEPSPVPKSDLYRELLPLLNGGRCELPNLRRLLSQLLSLERRTSRAGKDSIDHPPRCHDDLANAVAGVFHVAGSASQSCGVLLPTGELIAFS